MRHTHNPRHGVEGRGVDGEGANHRRPKSARETAVTVFGDRFARAIRHAFIFARRVILNARFQYIDGIRNEPGRHTRTAARQKERRGTQLATVGAFEKAA